MFNSIRKFFAPPVFAVDGNGLGSVVEKLTTHDVIVEGRSVIGNCFTRRHPLVRSNILLVKSKPFTGSKTVLNALWRRK